LVKLRIIAVGKDKDPWITQGIAHYTKLLKRFARIEIVLVPAGKATPNLSAEEITGKEAARLIKLMGSGVSVALYDKSKPMDTAEFARWLQLTIDRSGGSVDFIIGGAFGLHRSVLAAADECLALSPLTFSHRIVRLVLLEQLYRGFSVIHGTNYHK